MHTNVQMKDHTWWIPSLVILLFIFSDRSVELLVYVRERDGEGEGGGEGGEGEREKERGI